jgi:hypothetical protein
MFGEQYVEILGLEDEQARVTAGSYIGRVRPSMEKLVLAEEIARP